VIDRVFVRLVRAAEKQPFHAAYPFAAAAWVAALRMLGERFTVYAGAPLGRSPVLWWLHIFAFYLALVFSISALIARIAPADFKKTVNVVGVGLLLGVVPPWIDAAVYGPGAFAYEYQSSLAGIPWLLYAPPRMLPAGEAIVLWTSIACVAAFGIWRGRGWTRKLALAPAYYALTLLFQTFVPRAAHALADASPQAGFSEWVTVLLVGCAMAAHAVGIGAGRRAMQRLPQIALAPLFVATGAALRGRADGQVLLTAFVFALLSLGFALANDFYDRKEDAAAGRATVMDADAATIATVLPLVAAGAAVAGRPEMGLAAVAFAVVAHGYHADPLRTKCIFPLSYKTEGLLAGLAFLAGLCADPRALPAGAEVLVAAALALGAPVAFVFKDYKDVDADRSAGVRTAFVFWEERGGSRRAVLRVSAALLLTSLLVAGAFIHAQGATGAQVAVLAALALAASAALVWVRTPARAVAAAMLAAEAFLALGAGALYQARASAPVPAPEPPAARARAVAFLLAQQKDDGSFRLDEDRIFEIWDTLVVLEALQGASVPGEALERGWAFVRANLRADGIAYHTRNAGTDHACTETTALLHAIAPADDAPPTDAACALALDSTDGEGRVRVNTERALIPEELQRYPSVTGFALLLAARCPAYRAAKSELLAGRARFWLRHPEQIAPLWQYYGTEYYALYALARGLERAAALDDDTRDALAAYIATHQRQDGAVENAAASDQTTTSVELHTALALSALAAREMPSSPAAPVLDRGLAFLRARQRADGSLDGGYFRGGDFRSGDFRTGTPDGGPGRPGKREDLYATSLLVELLRARP
jgi:4-hydroxybenzoate polyprenyltransferase